MARTYTICYPRTVWLSPSRRLRGGRGSQPGSSRSAITLNHVTEPRFAGSSALRRSREEGAQASFRRLTTHRKTSTLHRRQNVSDAARSDHRGFPITGPLKPPTTIMNSEICSKKNDHIQTVDAVDDLARLAAIGFGHLDAERILDKAGAAVAALTPCHVEAAYRCAGGLTVGCPARQPGRPDIESQLPPGSLGGPVRLAGVPWAWAYALRGHDTVHGYLVVGADDQPTRQHCLLLTLLAEKAGAALAGAEIHARDAGLVRRLDETQGELHQARQQLRERTIMHETLIGALVSGSGEIGIAEALHRVTGLAVCAEDRFGNLLARAGPDQPQPHPKPDPNCRQRLLRMLAGRNAPMRVKARVAVLVRSRAEVFGVLSLVDPELRAGDEQLVALEYAATMLAMVLAHRRNLAEIELSVRRELLDDLLAGTVAASAYARAEALGHDLHCSHYVVLVQHPHATGTALGVAVCQAAAALDLHYLHGRRDGMVVLLVDNRPEPRGFHRAVSERLGNTAAVVGIGSRCQSPEDVPESFAKALRALNIRLRSSAPYGASAYDELGFYRLVDAAQVSGTVNDYVREWLGVLLDYDENKHSEFVATLGHYLECGGNYDDTAAALTAARCATAWPASAN